MDSHEATRIVFSRIQSLDPENASKIVGYILIQDPGEREMIRLAFGPETVLLSLINQAKAHLGLSSNTSSTSSTPSAPSPFNPLSNPNRLNPLPPSSPRIIIPNNGFHMNPSSPSSPWSVTGFFDHQSPVVCFWVFRSLSPSISVGSLSSHGLYKLVRMFSPRPVPKRTTGSNINDPEIGQMNSLGGSFPNRAPQPNSG